MDTIANVTLSNGVEMPQQGFGVGGTDKFSHVVLAYLLPDFCRQILHIALPMRPVCLLNRTEKSAPI